MSEVLNDLIKGLVLLLMPLIAAAVAMAIRWLNGKHAEAAAAVATSARDELRGAAADAAKEQQQFKPSGATRSPGDNREIKAAATAAVKENLGATRMAAIEAVLGEDATQATLSTGIEAAVHDMKASAPPVVTTVSPPLPIPPLTVVPP